MQEPTTKKSKPSTSRPMLTRERICAAGCDIADQNGVAGVTMRAVAAALGVEAMSLYNHISNKRDLFHAMADHVAAQIKCPSSGGDWLEAMRGRALSMQGVLMAHPWVGVLLLSNPTPGPAMLGLIEATLACLAAAGFAPQEGDHIWNAMDSYIYGFTLQAINFPYEAEKYAEAAQENLEMIPSEVFPNLRALAETVAARNYDGLHDMMYGFDVLLEGLNTRYKPSL